jgi:hypothetical protein
MQGAAAASRTRSQGGGAQATEATSSTATGASSSRPHPQITRSYTYRLLHQDLVHKHLFLLVHIKGQQKGGVWEQDFPQFCIEVLCKFIIEI